MSRCATPDTSGRTRGWLTLLVERYAEAVEGDIRMNCDVCVHRVALPGFEEKVGAPATPHYHPDEPGHHSHGHHPLAVALEERVLELAAEVPPADEAAVRGGPGAAPRAGQAPW